MTKSTPNSPNKVTPVSSPNASRTYRLTPNLKTDPRPSPKPHPYHINRVFTMGVSPSIMIAYCMKSPTHNNPQQGKHYSYIWPGLTLFNEATKETREQLEISAITSRRLNRTSNESIPDKPGSGYPAKQFVYFVANPDDNTVQKRRVWGLKIARWLHELAQTDAFKYKCTFQYEMDKTGDTPLLPASHCLHDTDIVQLIEQNLSHVPLEDAEFVSQFFGEDQVEHGRNILAAAKRNGEDAALSDDDGEWWK